MGNISDREVACSVSDRQGSNYEFYVWRAVSSFSYHHPHQKVLLAQFRLHVHRGGLKPHSFYFIICNRTIMQLLRLGGQLHYTALKSQYMLTLKWSDSIYGIRRSLIVIGSITEVKQRRARFIIGWVTACDCQVLYTLVWLREPRKSDGSSDWPRVGRKRTSIDVGAISIRRDPRKSTMCEYLAHKVNLLGMKIAWCASMAAQLYISQETELEFEW